MNHAIATIATSTMLLMSPTLSYASDGLTDQEVLNSLINNPAIMEYESKEGDAVIYTDGTTGLSNESTITASAQINPYKVPGKFSTTIGGNVQKPNFTSPTNPSESRGNITENVGEDGQQFDEDVPPKRQFLSFQTSTGKEFHLIIDYTKNEQQVRMLTEVSESDLLNLINKARKESGELKENEESKEEMEARLKAELEEKIKKEQADKLLAEQQAKANEKGDSSLFIILIAALAVGGFGYYKKVYLKNKNSVELDEYDEDEEENEYIDEYDESYDDEFYDKNEYPENTSTSSTTSNELDIEKKNDSELEFEDGFEEDFEEEFNKKDKDSKEI